MTSILFCLDFDETLMATDRLRADVLEKIRELGKEELVATYQEAYETTREQHGVPRVPLVLKTMKERFGLDFETHQSLAKLFHDFPYQDYIYDGVEQTIAHLKEYGQVLLLSDGEPFFQPQKVYATTVANMVDGIVVLPSKISSFDDLSGYWPAEKYVFIDDKQKVLDAAKEYFGDKVTTVLVRQGRYADASETTTSDMSVTSIADVVTIDF